MKTSDAGRKFIEDFEGLVLKASDDGFGNPTIGYGHTTPQGPPHVAIGDVITEKEADQILSRDLHTVEYDVNTWTVVPVNQNQFDALVSFTFNVGAGNFKTSTLLKELNNRNYIEAADEFLKWNHANGKVVAGLTRRREAERKMFLSSVPVVSGTPVEPAPKPVPQPGIITIIINFLKGLFNVNNSTR